jgi:membrane-bound serine protease (ClpP class)
VRIIRLAVLAAVACGAVVAGAGGAGAQDGERARGRIDVVQVNGLLDPPNAALITSTLRGAERRGVEVLVYQIDASGAVDVDVARLVRAFRDATVPIAAWVGPSNGGARGAGALLALAAGHAAVAPGADFGPVRPVYYDDPDRPVPGAEPLLGRTIEARAPTLQDFVASLDGLTIGGRQVSTLTGRPGQRTLSQDVHFHKLDLGQQLAHTLNSPWVAYFLFVAGLLLIVFEFFTAAIGIAGFVGALAVVGGSFGFSHLPVAPWAVALLLVGVFGLSVDVQSGGLGVWTFIGAGALTAGSLWLYDGSSRLDPRWWVLALVIGGSVVFMLSAMTAMVRARFSTPTIGREDLVGEMGSAEVDVDPDGVVRVRDALWRARTNRATPIRAGDAVRVVAVEGVVLEVEPESGGARDYRERGRRR